MRIPLNRAFRGRQHRSDSDRTRKKVLAPIVALGLMASMFQVFMNPEPASASVTDYKPATYNMQGGYTGDQSKWTTDVIQIIRRGYNVIALQEAGSGPPPRATYQHSYWGLGRTDRHMGWTVDVYDWQPGSSREFPTQWRIYFMRTQTGGDRVNLAFVTDRYVSGVDVAPPNRQFYNGQGQPTARPALGIIMGDTQFWNVHALSGNGNDGRGLVENISRRAGWRHWAAMGDWNRIPSRQDFGLGRIMYTSGQPTQHSADNELDYMVSNEEIPGYGGNTMTFSSDHNAVGFHRLMANADVQLLNLSNHGQHMGLITTSNGSHVVNSGYPGLEHWWLKYMGGDNYSIVNARINKCMSNYQGRLIIWDCNGAPDQLFDLHYYKGWPGHIQLRPSNDRSHCIQDDGRDGFGGDFITTANCNSGRSRFKSRSDWDPGPDAAPVFF